MVALILNSGSGKRMGSMTEQTPKCMLQLEDGDTILSRQLKQLELAGVDKVVLTTGGFHRKIVEYCGSISSEQSITFVNNPQHDNTNYIYSIILAEEYLQDDILLMHGDLVFEYSVLQDMLDFPLSCMATSSEKILPAKDFKAVLTQDEGDSERKIVKVGIDFFDDAVAAQPLYKLKKEDWQPWLVNIKKFCDRGNQSCYAEDALNEVSGLCNIYAYDVKDRMCGEIDTSEDLESMRSELRRINNRTVYMCFSTELFHGGHINLVKKAMQYGKVTAGVLSDEAVASYKRFPLLSYSERAQIVGSLRGIEKVIEQKTLSYEENIREIRPDFVIHGDDWVKGFQAPVRKEVIRLLEEYGGKLIEFPYCDKKEYRILDEESRKKLSIPDIRRGRLRKLMSMKKIVTIIEAHSGITGLIAEKTTVLQDGKTYQFDGMWVSSLCDSTAKGKPDIELVDFSSRLRTIDDIMEVTTKPVILDGDTGGLIEHFVYTVRTLERMGVSAVIIEDKVGLKKNSLFGTDIEQTQDSIEHFCAKIAAGKKAQRTKEFMIIARIESLILEKGISDAIQRAKGYVEAGADGIMIHSRKKDPEEIFEFVKKFRDEDSLTPIVVVPTSFNSVTEEEFAARGVNIVIYANQLTRSGFPAMQKVAEEILKNHRAEEADEMCMPIKDILTLIPEED